MVRETRTRERGERRGGMWRSSHPVNVRLIFRVGDIGRSIVPVFHLDPAQ